MSLVLNVFMLRFFVFYLLWHHNLQATESSSQSNFFFCCENEVKTFGHVQQLILRMLRDLILQSRNSHSLNGDLPTKKIIFSYEAVISLQQKETNFFFSFKISFNFDSWFSEFLKKVICEKLKMNRGSWITSC